LVTFSLGRSQKNVSKANHLEWGKRLNSQEKTGTRYRWNQRNEEDCLYEDVTRETKHQPHNQTPTKNTPKPKKKTTQPHPPPKQKKNPTNKKTKNKPKNPPPKKKTTTKTKQNKPKTTNKKKKKKNKNPPKNHQQKTPQKPQQTTTTNPTKKNKTTQNRGEYEKLVAGRNLIEKKGAVSPRGRKKLLHPYMKKLSYGKEVG